MGRPTPEDLLAAFVRLRQLDRFEPADVADSTAITETLAVVAAAGGPSTTAGQRASAAMVLITHYLYEVVYDRVDHLVGVFALTIHPDARGKNITERKSVLHADHGVGREAFDGRVRRVLVNLGSWLYELSPQEARRIVQLGPIALDPEPHSAIRQRLATERAVEMAALRPTPRQPPGFVELRPYYVLIATGLEGFIEAAELWLRAARSEGGLSEQHGCFTAALWWVGLMQQDFATFTMRYGHRWEFGDDSERFEAHLARLGMRLNVLGIGLWMYSVVDGDDLGSLRAFDAAVRGTNGELIKRRWMELAAACNCNSDESDTTPLPEAWSFDGSSCYFHEGLTAGRECLDILDKYGIRPGARADIVRLL